MPLDCVLASVDALLGLLLDLPLRSGTVGGAVLDSNPPLDRALLGADDSFGTGWSFDTLAFHALRRGSLAFDTRTLDSLALDSLRPGFVHRLRAALDDPVLGAGAAFNAGRPALGLYPLARLRPLGADSLPNLRALSSDSLPSLRPLSADALLTALGCLRARRGALCALLGSLGLLSPLPGLAALGTLGLRGSSDCECRHGGDQKCLGHKKFQYGPVVPALYQKACDSSMNASVGQHSDPLVRRAVGSSRRVDVDLPKTLPSGCSRSR